jgi:uncharacterized protein (DUF4213/DUF364 family)
MDIAGMWELYNKLIEEIPPDYRVDEAVIGDRWTMVCSGVGVGLAMTLHERNRPERLPVSGGVAAFRGLPLAELAEAAKSWNFAEASLGMAAINAYWNSPERKPVQEALERGHAEAFLDWRDRIAGKKVVVIGHFFQLEETLGKVCDLSILEKQPRPGDYPDSACEFLLPSQDFVFATGVTLINKTLPRLLELSRHTGIILAGPSVPLAPPLFDWQVRDLQGFVVTDPALCGAILRGEKTGLPVFSAGVQVSIPKKEPPQRTPKETWKKAVLAADSGRPG